MKVPLLGDLHFGVKNDARFMLEYQLKFMEEVFIPYMVDNDIKVFIQFGDFFDRRKYTNHETLFTVRERILKKLKQLGIKMIISTGNHDVYQKNTNRINTIDMFMSEFDNIEQIHEPTEYCLDGVKFLQIPWITNDNESQVLQAMRDTDAKYLIGHLDIIGHEMYAGVPSTHGYDSKVFKKFTEVWTGHYHHKSFVKNIRYVGTPYEMTWSDADDPKGFHVFDTQDHSIEFIRNHDVLHEKIVYNDTTKEGLYYLKNIDYSKFSGKIVKILVDKKSHTDLFEKLVEKLYDQKIVDLTINEDMSEFFVDNVDVAENLTTDKLINEYIDNVDDTTVNKEKLKKVLHDLHLEALLGFDR